MKMKKFILRFIQFVFVFTAFFYLLGIWDEIPHTLNECLLRSVMLSLLVSLALIIDDKGWNSWSHIAGLFRRGK